MLLYCCCALTYYFTTPSQRVLGFSVGASSENVNNSTLRGLYREYGSLANVIFWTLSATVLIITCMRHILLMRVRKGKHHFPSCLVLDVSVRRGKHRGCPNAVKRCFQHEPLSPLRVRTCTSIAAHGHDKPAEAKRRTPNTETPQHAKGNDQRHSIHIFRATVRKQQDRLAREHCDKEPRDPTI